MSDHLDAPKKRPDAVTDHRDTLHTREQLAGTRQMQAIDESTLPGLFVDRRDQLKSRWSSEWMFRKGVRELLNMALGDQMEHTPKLADEKPDLRSRRPRFAPNMLGAALDQLSYLYANDPIRRVAGEPENSPGSAAWQSSLWGAGCGLTALLQDADPQIRMTGTGLALCQPGERPGQVDVMVLQPDRWVAMSGQDRRKVGAVAVYWDSFKPKDSAQIDVHHYWDDQFHAVLHNWKPVMFEEHGMDGVPAVTLKNTLSPLSIYGEPLGGTDLATNVRTLNQLWEKLVWLDLLEGGQWVFREKPDQFVRSTTAALVTGQDNEGRCEPTNTDYSGFLASLQAILTALAVDWKMPTRTFKVTGSTPESGVRIVVDRLELQEDRVKRERIARQWEKGIAECAARVLGGGAPPLPVDVRYLPQPPILSYDQTLSQVQWEYEHGLADEYEAKRRLHPHLSEQEIARLVEAGQDSWQRRMEEEIRRAGHADGDAVGEGDIEGEVAPPGVDSVQDTALNGAQVTALAGVVQAVAEGRLPAGAARLIVANSFPAFDDEEAGRMVQEASISSMAAEPPPAVD